jgi:hypothetical protein
MNSKKYFYSVCGYNSAKWCLKEGECPFSFKLSNTTLIDCEYATDTHPILGHEKSELVKKDR